MKLSQVVDWEQEVLVSWRRAAVNSNHANSDIWSRLPPGVAWLVGEIEAQDVAQMHVVGSQDWVTVFGSYQLQHIVERFTADQASGQVEDAYSHHKRISRLLSSLAFDCRHLPDLILVANDARGPFVLLDGNHRALALLQMQKLVGRRCYLGLHAEMATKFLWMQRVLAAQQASAAASSSNAKEGAPRG